VDWINLAQDRDKLRAFIDTVMNVSLPPNYDLGKQLVASQEEICSTE
jgi:hypothetical protein